MVVHIFVWVKLSIGTSQAPTLKGIMTTGTFWQKIEPSAAPVTPIELYTFSVQEKLVQFYHISADVINVQETHCLAMLRILLSNLCWLWTPRATLTMSTFLQKPHSLRLHCHCLSWKKIIWCLWNTFTIINIILILVKIFCRGGQACQVHLLLSEKVRVSQTSQSRPAALTTSYMQCTTLHWPLATPSTAAAECDCDLATPPMQCNAVLLWCRSGQRWAAPLMLLAEKLTDSDTWSQVKPRWAGHKQGFQRTYFPQIRWSIYGLLRHGCVFRSNQGRKCSKC